jgi:drug/metabolite transporter (DMT)-like permease
MGISPQGLGWCILFFFLGPTLILVNNYVFNNLHYKYPIFFSSLGIMGVVLVTRVSEWLGFIVVNKNISIEFWLTRILPIGLLSAATIGSGNSVYLYLSVSFTQMLKALTPVYILACLSIFRVENPSGSVVLAVIIISVGTMIASVGELRFSWIGFFLQSFADLLEGSRLVLLQIILTQNLSPIESMYYTAPATAFCQLVMVFIYEPEAILKSSGVVRQYWYIFVAATVLGICINFIGMFVIKHTSGLMLKLIGVVRNNCLVIFSVFFLGEVTTLLQMVGYLVSVVGFVWYTNLTHGGKSESPQLPVQDRKKYYSRLYEHEEEMNEL